MLHGQGASAVRDCLADFVLNPEALRYIPRAIALRYDVLSLGLQSSGLTVAVPDDADDSLLDRLRAIAATEIVAVSAPREAIRAKLATAYETRGDEAPAIRAVNEIHDRAVASRASDVHLEPGGSGGRVRQRIDGMLHHSTGLDEDLFAQVVSRIKLLAGMDIADKRQPQDGVYAMESHGRTIDVRVSSMPTIAGEKLVLRFFDHGARIPSLEHLGMPEHLLERYRRAVLAPNGFIVVSGPTGSGKTTTLYASLAERNAGTQNLCTVEDPVEVRIAGVAQVQVNERAGVTFESVLRAFLRQDPNVVMLGEMRDARTASAALSAALSGQLLLTTVHSNDAPRTLERLAELGVARQSLAAGLSAVVAQRLVRLLCADCRRRGPHGFVAGGCTACDGTGYRGRTGIFEVIFVDRGIASAIADGESSARVAALARESGYEPLTCCGMARVRAGDTSFDEIERVCAGTT